MEMAMGNGLLILILVLTALGAMLSGMSVFSVNRPPDLRLNQVLHEMEELKELVGQLQKALAQMERKQEKDQKESKTEAKENLEKLSDKLEKRIQELMS